VWRCFWLAVSRAATVVGALESNAQRFARYRRLAFAQRGQVGVHIVARLFAQQRDVRRKLHRRCQFALEDGSVDDPSQLANALRPCRKVDGSAGYVALDVHVVHGSGGMRRQRVPNLQALQQPDRRGVQRIGPHVGHSIGCGIVCGVGTHSVFAHRHLQPQARQRQRQAFAHDAGAANEHVELIHWHGL